jgi:hypothetical protein
VLADVGYHSLKNLNVVAESGVVPVIAVNPYGKGKAGKVSDDVFFGGRRWSVGSLMGIVRFMCFVVAGLGRGVF